MHSVSLCLSHTHPYTPFFTKNAPACLMIRGHPPSVYRAVPSPYVTFAHYQLCGLLMSLQPG